MAKKTLDEENFEMDDKETKETVDAVNEEEIEDQGVWKPICKVASAYDFNEEQGIYEQSMSPVELQQDVETKEIRAVVIKS